MFIAGMIPSPVGFTSGINAAPEDNYSGRFGAINRERYVRDERKYGTYGVFDLPEGVTVRHHDPRWIEDLTRDFDELALDPLDVQTMNGNPAQGFQWFGLKRK